MSSQINPRNPRHVAVEKQVAEYLDESNYIVDESTYHASMRPETVDRLSRLYTPESLYIRGKADRVAVHRTLDICFLWEVKTNQSCHRNMSIECLPLCHHIKSGVRCLYVLENSDGNQYGFWTTGLPAICKVFVPSRWSGEMREFFVSKIRECFGSRLQICGIARPQGSGDPFCIIHESEVQKCFDWRQELNRVTEAGGFGGDAPDGLFVMAG